MTVQVYSNWRNNLRVYQVALRSVSPANWRGDQHHEVAVKKEKKKKRRRRRRPRRRRQRRSFSARNASWWIGHPWLIWQADFLVFGDWQGAHGASAPVGPNGPSWPRRISLSLSLFFVLPRVLPISARVSTKPKVGPFEKLIEPAESPWKC